MCKIAPEAEMESDAVDLGTRKFVNFKSSNFIASSYIIKSHFAITIGFTNSFKVRESALEKKLKATKQETFNFDFLPKIFSVIECA